MWMMAPFILNSLLNFVVSLLVAKFLGPAEYGRFVLALSVAVVVQTFVFDWLRLAATRFYAERDRLERPQIRATLDASFSALAALAIFAAFLLWALRLDLPLSHDLAALAVGVSVTNALFDTATALVRARFHDKAYGALVIAKNILAFALTVGGAYLFHSANVALVGMMVSVAGCLLVARRELVDPNTGFRAAERALVARFFAYGFPIIIAAVLYQAVPLINRTLLSEQHGFAEVGRLSLAFETGIRIVGAIGSAVDVILFQIAVHAEKTDGADAARAQISRNLGVVFAVLAPAVAGCWLILPSFEALFVPETFRGSFGHYFALMIPALFAFAMMNYGVNTAFQLAHRLTPLIIAALVAQLANLLAIMLLPATADATRFAYAQSISSMSGLVALVSMLFLLEPMWPRARDIMGAAAGVGAMLYIGAPLRNFEPCILTMLLQVAAGVAVYGVLVYAFDVAGLRSLIGPKIVARLRREPQLQ
ncbi:lipopolysaccharide biosynthesis protein [Methylocystis parvus]|uniref:Oligosaccharide flippase family protein n=1 Tax=Methylocystis parvus TaxID=134 RepID=A0A6B8M0V8_9HYPH|nr:oligosaccharide flippase family protein [Methylocystis parvus]QGM96481.1 oligosaccharide flippase family protein [Methylocystis parvus]WBJ99668.1 oligosaccharide flippase family protein [Methylocystis parvus OBBP]